jgi:hypothetical protein
MHSSDKFACVQDTHTVTRSEGVTRSTLDFPIALWNDVREASREHGLTLRQIVWRGLELALAELKKKKAKNAA